MSMGGGGSGSSTTQTSNIPEYARPYVETMLGATQKQLFNTTTGADGKTEITGFKPYQPFSSNVQDYFAPQDKLTGQVYNEAMGMQTPGQFAQATGYANQAAQGGLDSTGIAYGYGQQGFQSGQLGQNLGIAGGAKYGQQGADIGMMGLRAEDYGRQVSRQAEDYARQAAQAGQQYAAQATNPLATQAYMSPYMQNVVDTQKAAAIRDYQAAMPALNAQAARAGAFGGSRDAIARSEAARNLTSQLQNIQAQGQQQAFQNAQQAQQFGANLGLQGLSGAQQGLGTALQGGQLGLSGIGTALQGQQVGLQGVDRQLAGTAQGMQGAQVGLQGVSGAQAGYGLANQAASNLANIGTQQQQADLARMGFQNQMGQQNQAYQQQLINQQIQDYATAQQYPYMQLGMMSNMLRGLPMQQMTTQGYQAYNPVAQLGGLGTAAYGAYKMFGKKGGLPKDFEKKYDVGGAVEADLRRLPDAKLVELTKTSPSKTIREEAAKILREHALENQENPAVASGLAAAPAPNLTPMMAGGGIVAFGPGGDVEEEEKTPGLENVQSYLKGLGALGYGQQTPEQKALGAEILAAKEEAKKDKEMAKYAALTRFGLGMAGAKTSNLAQAISQGGEEGLKEYADQQKAANEALNKIRSGEIDLNKLSTTERNNLLHYAVTGATSEANTKMRMDELREQAKLRYAQTLNAKEDRFAAAKLNAFNNAFNQIIKSKADKLGINKLTNDDYADAENRAMSAANKFISAATSKPSASSSENDPLNLRK